MNELDLQDYRGTLLSITLGDALGTTLELSAPCNFEPITDLVGGGLFCLEPGQWTDDTSITLCLAASLVGSGGFDTKDSWIATYAGGGKAP